MVCAWDPVAGATDGYAVRYELTLDVRGRTRKFQSEGTTTSTQYIIGAGGHVTAARLQVAAKGPDGPGPHTEWAVAARPAPCSQGSALSGRGLSSHRHGDGPCHVHHGAVPECSAVEDVAYTVHAAGGRLDAVAGVVGHREGVVRACAPSGLGAPVGLEVSCEAYGRVTAKWEWTADAPGHGTTTAAIPARGEPALPETGDEHTHTPDPHNQPLHD